MSSVCPTKLYSNQFPQLQRLSRKMKVLSEIFDYLREIKPSMLAIYSEIVALVIILLVIPATHATSERTFSALPYLRRVKTYLRITMTQTRINNLITFHVHKEKTDTLRERVRCKKRTTKVHVWNVLISVV